MNELITLDCGQDWDEFGTKGTAGAAQDLIEL